VTGSISRTLYKQILYLHPEPFRREFGNEMLSIFDECKATQGSFHLLADLFLSALKQQIHYLAIPAPRRTPVYLDIASSPNLARMLAIAVLTAGVIAGVFVPEAKPKAESWRMVRSEPRVWYSPCEERVVIRTMPPIRPVGRYPANRTEIQQVR
jgi:hypothetical protein